MAPAGDNQGRSFWRTYGLVVGLTVLGIIGLAAWVRISEDRNVDLMALPLLFFSFWLLDILLFIPLGRWIFGDSFRRSRDPTRSFFNAVLAAGTFLIVAGAVVLLLFVTCAAVIIL